MESSRHESDTARLSSHPLATFHQLVDGGNFSKRKLSPANLVLLHANLAYATQTEDSGKTHNNHPSKQGPESCAISSHKRIRGRFVNVVRSSGPRVGND
jgi:hypothetical protein